MEKTEKTGLLIEVEFSAHRHMAYVTSLGSFVALLSKAFEVKVTGDHDGLDFDMIDTAVLSPSKPVIMTVTRLVTVGGYVRIFNVFSVAHQLSFVYNAKPRMEEP